MAAASCPGQRPFALLLDGIHPDARRQLLPWADVLEVPGGLADVDAADLARATFIGVRSKSTLTRTALDVDATPALQAIGCFCIGTDQVDLPTATARGVPVFNSPFANTRSVAEWVVAQCINLNRRLGDQARDLHAGRWRKSAKDCHEVRGQTLGIVGYGRVGSQVSVLAEALGMRVQFVDVAPVLALGGAVAAPSLRHLLHTSDVVTLHVPLTPHTRGLLDAAHVAELKPGALLLNASRGEVLDLDAVAAALRQGRVRGVAVDVFPHEPATNDAVNFATPLQGLPNVMLSSHVGGSTEEAQAAIGADVARKWEQWWQCGTTVGAVNVPPVQLTAAHEPRAPLITRFTIVHRNEAGALQAITAVLRDAGANIAAETLNTRDLVGWLVVDVEPSAPSASSVPGWANALQAQLEMLPVVTRCQLHDRRVSQEQ